MKAVVRELTAVVGGSGNGNGGALAKSSHPIELNQDGHVTAYSSGTGGKKSLTPSIKREGNKGGASGWPKKREVRPKQVILLGKGDFEEF